MLNKQVYFTLIERICWAILIWEQYLQKKFVLFLACNQTANYLRKTNTNIPVEISAKLSVNFQHNMKYYIIDSNYYCDRANEAVKAAKSTWELIHV